MGPSCSIVSRDWIWINRTHYYSQHVLHHNIRLVQSHSFYSVSTINTEVIKAALLILIKLGQYITCTSRLWKSCHGLFVVSRPQIVAFLTKIENPTIYVNVTTSSIQTVPQLNQTGLLRPKSFGSKSLSSNEYKPISLIKETKCCELHEALMTLATWTMGWSFVSLYPGLFVISAFGKESNKRER